MPTTVLVVLLVLLLLAPMHAQAGDRITGRAFATRSEVIARHGMAATSQPLATQIALDVLKAGGSAVDAAIAANAALGLMEPTGCGIGGDLFAIVWDPETGKLHGLNASGRSPKGLTREHFAREGLTEIPKFGPLPVSVPGCVDGWRALNARFGKLPLATLLEPAIRYAREGFPVSELIAHYWGRGARVFSKYPGFNETFLPGGKAPAKGDIFRNPGLAETYETIATKGARAFYEGSIAASIDAWCRKHGCFLRKEDLAAHRSEWVDPVSVNYRGYDVWELPPNGQGIAALQMLGILEGFDLAGMGHNSAAYLHHLVEAKKLAYEDRARFYADMSMAKVPVAGLIDEAYAAKRRALLDPKRAAQAVPHGSPKLKEGDTIYLTVADGNRMMVSLIQSNYRGFGSGMCPDGPRLLPAEPRRDVHARRRPPQRLCTGQAPIPHDHPRLRHEGRQAVALLRRHGRRHAAAGARADPLQPHRLRHERAGGGGRPALPPHRLQHPHRPRDEGRRRAAPRVGHRRRRAQDVARPRPSHRACRRALRRLPGDPLRREARCVPRRVGVP